MKLVDREKAWLLREKYHGQKCPEYIDDARLIEAGEPVAYVIGSQPFLHCDIDLTYRPLIPRPETEHWLKQVIDEIEERDVAVLDIFSGSGCIGVAVLDECENASVIFSEVNPLFIKQIRINTELNDSDSAQFSIIQSDVFESVPGGASFDYILANPPYIDRGDRNTADKTVIDHEDHESLFADDQGLYFVKKLINESPAYLKPAGKLYIEFDPWQTEILTPLLEQQDIWNWKYQKDQYGKERVLVLAKK